MNPKRLQALGILLGIALFVATGLLIFTGADRSSSSKPGNPSPVTEASTASLRQLSDTFAEVAAHVKPCVVSIHSQKVVKLRRPEWQFPFGEDSPFRWFFGDEPPPGQRQPREREFRQRGLGSGIIVDKNGHILTNHHVVRDMDEIKVTLSDNRKIGRAHV